ncbi:Oxaloacetate decarboxylase, gamma chain [Stieleria maiorica]|uniref:Oxaloacetate decarboxylase, gamma chain n=1 Tax=Stieleria maiorica TaxID=2795974 RepID=A0A5B9MN36_9BACT|nr:OadG family protein [Stieleria maiorica]QEG02723.1 Oxaloacetate decarboxylase, gamma chain [Stieleria maiorica]
MLATKTLSVMGNLLAFDETALRGISIAVAGMLIVMLALILISLFIAASPRILAAVAKVYPEPVERHRKRTESKDRDGGEEAVLAAIGFVLHTEFQKQCASEDGPSARDG